MTRSEEAGRAVPGDWGQSPGGSKTSTRPAALDAQVEAKGVESGPAKKADTDSASLGSVLTVENLFTILPDGTEDSERLA